MAQAAARYRAGEWSPDLTLDETAKMLLSPSELVAITGYRRARDQIAWIRDHYGINAYVNAQGEAVVLRAHLEAATKAPPKKPELVEAQVVGVGEFIQSRPEIRSRRISWTPGAGFQGPGIYFLFLRYALVYVGQSVDIASRVQAHCASVVTRSSRFIPFTSFSWIEVPHCMLNAVELHYIHRDAPPFNIKDNINSTRVWRVKPHGHSLYGAE